jgi:hypothetical protein
VDSGYLGLTDKWAQGEGSGAVTRHVLDTVGQNPQLYAAFNTNPYIPQNAANRLNRDAGLSGEFGGVRQDLQNARQIMSQGPGGLDRLREALGKGVALPAIGAGVFAPALLRQGEPQPTS